ncbi:MAG: hypothetical protein RR902_00750 [Oscillospiraceae bacterium]
MTYYQQGYIIYLLVTPKGKNGGEKMYQNLKENLHKKRITIRDYAKLLGVTEKTVQNKINGNTDFTLQEAETTRRVLFPEFDLFYLFELSIQ